MNAQRRIGIVVVAEIDFTCKRSKFACVDLFHDSKSGSFNKLGNALKFRPHSGRIKQNSVIVFDHHGRKNPFKLFVDIRCGNRCKIAVAVQIFLYQFIKCFVNEAAAVIRFFRSLRPLLKTHSELYQITERTLIECFKPCCGAHQLPSVEPHGRFTSERSGGIIIEKHFIEHIETRKIAFTARKM